MSSLKRKRPVKKQRRYVKISGPCSEVREGKYRDRGDSRANGKISYFCLCFYKGCVITLIYMITLWQSALGYQWQHQYHWWHCWELLLRYQW